MTDTAQKTPGPADTPANRAIVEQTHFSKAGIWLPQYAVLHFNAGVTVIADKVFEDCVFEGPGVMLALEDNSFDGCNFGVAEIPSSLLWRPVGPKVVGAVPFRNCRFVRCRFAMIGFSGHEPFMDAVAGIQSRGSQ
ncbi:hypothetical protein [Brevundimonas sp.]|jgi:hypothetical protein|uniref:hypothetical protein n=1 Tax=Brevundimonas sp. TaxID=1871086 RepID=UPI00391BAA44|nr:hypothetical protein [Brevundimonas sp.]